MVTDPAYFDPAHEAFKKFAAPYIVSAVVFDYALPTPIPSTPCRSAPVARRFPAAGLTDRISPSRSDTIMTTVTLGHLDNTVQQASAAAVARVLEAYDLEVEYVAASRAGMEAHMRQGMWTCSSPHGSPMSMRVSWRRAGHGSLRAALPSCLWLVRARSGRHRHHLHCRTGRRRLPGGA
ncbi:hypothetical protein RAA17_10100 [Komagataeibacter rhaeticus]|nr:hypothetical protein [Komagataeibacter rhaeticus]